MAMTRVQQPAVGRNSWSAGRGHKVVGRGQPYTDLWRNSSPTPRVAIHLDTVLCNWGSEKTQGFHFKTIIFLIFSFVWIIEKSIDLFSFLCFQMQRKTWFSCTLFVFMYIVERLMYNSRINDNSRNYWRLDPSYTLVRLGPQLLQHLLEMKRN